MNSRELHYMFCESYIYASDSRAFFLFLDMRMKYCGNTIINLVFVGRNPGIKLWNTFLVIYKGLNQKVG